MPRCCVVATGSKQALASFCQYSPSIVFCTSLQIYPRNWPNLALHHATLAKLEMFLNHPHRALDACKAAMQILTVLQPDGSTVVSEMLRIRAEAEYEMHQQHQQSQMTDM